MIQPSRHATRFDIESPDGFIVVTKEDDVWVVFAPKRGCVRFFSQTNALRYAEGVLARARARRDRDRHRARRLAAKAAGAK